MTVENNGEDKALGIRREEGSLSPDSDSDRQKPSFPKSISYRGERVGVSRAVRKGHDNHSHRKGLVGKVIRVLIEQIDRQEKLIEAQTLSGREIRENLSALLKALEE